MVLISAYNLLLKNKHYYSHLDVKWVTCMFISQKKKKNVPSSGSSLSVDSEWKKTLTVLHLFPHLKFLRRVRFARVGLLALCSGRPPSRSLRMSIKSHKCNGILRCHRRHSGGFSALPQVEHVVKHYSPLVKLWRALQFQFPVPRARWCCGDSRKAAVTTVFH